MTLSQIIPHKIRRDHMGIEHPLTLESLLSWLNDRRCVKIIDEKSRKNVERRVRDIIASNLEICNAGEGYYWARSKGHKEDIEEAIRYIERTYKHPIDNKIKAKKQAFLQYYPELDACQGRLF